METWIEALPEEVQESVGEFKEDEAVTKYKTLPDFIKGFKEVSELAGKKGVIVPTDKSSPEEVSNFYKALGRPDTPEAYKLSEVKELHSDIKVSDQGKADYFKVAHAAGLTGKQADTLNSWYLTTMSNAMKSAEAAVKAQNDQAATALRQEWGEKYDENLAKTNSLIKRVGGDDAINAFGELGSNPQVLKVLGKIAGAISEDGINQLLGGSGGMSSEQAEEKIAAIKADQKHPYWDENHADHKKWVGPEGEMAKLYKAADAEKKEGAAT